MKHINGFFAALMFGLTLISLNAARYERLVLHDATGTGVMAGCALTGLLLTFYCMARWLHDVSREVPDRPLCDKRLQRITKYVDTAPITGRGVASVMLQFRDGTEHAVSLIDYGDSEDNARRWLEGRASEQNKEAEVLYSTRIAFGPTVVDRRTALVISPHPCTAIITFNYHPIFEEV